MKKIAILILTVFLIIPSVGAQQLNATITIDQQPLCYGDSTGVLSISSVTGGTGPYTYLWSNGKTTGSIDSLSDGTYFLTVTDFVGDVVVDSALISSPALLVSEISYFNSFCSDTLYDLMANSSGGTPPYSFLWGNSDTSKLRYDVLANNTYSLTITDSNSCKDTVSLYLLHQPFPEVVLDSQSNIRCNGDTNGYIRVKGIYGLAPYTYQWTTNPTSTTEILSGLSAGSYTVIITDVNSCSSIDTFIITEPNPLSVQLIDNNDGSASAMGGGGVPPYSYQWGTNTGNQTTQTVTGLTANTSYNMTVTDAVGCYSVNTLTTSTVSTSKIQAAKKVSISPNPFSEKILIDFNSNIENEVEVNLYDLSNKIVFSETVSSSKVFINTSSLALGVYYIHIYMRGASITRKIIKVE